MTPSNSKEDHVIEIRDPEINVQEIMAQIRERIRQRRTQAKERGLDYEHLVDDGMYNLEARRLPEHLYSDLHQLNAVADQILVALSMRDRRIPLFNFILFRVEELLHRLVVKYVNIMAGRQVTFNRAAVNVLSSLAHALEERDTRINSLETAIADLNERLAALELKEQK